MAELNNLLVAALAAAAEENIEVTTVVKEVQARLQVSDKSLFLCHKIPISFFTQIPIHCLIGTPRDPSSSVKTKTASEGSESEEERITRED